MNLQEIYDKAVFGVLNQGRQSIGGAHGVCLLRGNEGSKCAVGWLIPDEIYDPKMEPQSSFEDWAPDEDQDDPENDIWKSSFGKILLECIQFDGANDQLFEFLHALQNAHDEAPDMGTMKATFIDVANEWGLNHTVTAQFTFPVS